MRAFLLIKLSEFVISSPRAIKEPKFKICSFAFKAKFPSAAMMLSFLIPFAFMIRFLLEISLCEAIKFPCRFKYISPLA